MVSRDPESRRGPVLAWCMFVGAAYGAGTSILNHTGPAFLSALLGDGAAWAGLGLLSGWMLRKKSLTLWFCLLGTVIIFVFATLSYYISDILFSLPDIIQLQQDIDSGDIPPLPEEAARPSTVKDLICLQGQEAAAWVGMSVLLGIPVGLAGALMARRDLLGFLIQLSGPILLATYAHTLLAMNSAQASRGFLCISGIWFFCIISRQMVIRYNTSSH